MDKKRRMTEKVYKELHEKSGSPYRYRKLTKEEKEAMVENYGHLLEDEEEGEE